MPRTYSKLFSVSLYAYFQYLYMHVQHNSCLTKVLQDLIKET